MRFKDSGRGRNGLMIRRRGFLAAGATGLGVALAGCSAVADFLGGVFLKDVNVFNGTDSRLAGSIQVLDPNGDVVLEESFDIPSGEDSDDEEADEESMGIYEDVLTDAGEYTVSIELDDEVGGESETTETVEVTDPEEEHVMVFLGADEAADSIVIAVIDEFSDLEEYDDEFAE